MINNTEIHNSYIIEFKKNEKRQNLKSNQRKKADDPQRDIVGNSQVTSQRPQ